MAAPSTKERLRIRILIASHSSSKVPEQSRKHLPKTPWAPPELDLITIEIIVRNDWAGSTGRRNASVSRQHQLSLTEGDGDGKAVHR